MSASPIKILGTFYEFHEDLNTDLGALRQKVEDLRKVGKLSSEVLTYLRKYFRLKNIYHSNAIEGNRLNIGETRLVVEEGLTITGKPLKDTIEAKNLAHALDMFEQLANRSSEPISEVDIRSIHAAILKGIDDNNAGRYRTTDVEISGSAYRPPSHIDVPRMMAEFTQWLREVSVSQNGKGVDPVVLAAAAHTWFVYVHPFSDGNGRTARLILNLILIRYGYPIAVITRDDRERYYDALEDSQHGGDLTAIIKLVQECVEESLEEYENAAQQQREREGWARAVVSSLGEREEKRLRNEYEIWRSAMDLLRHFFEQSVNALNEAGPLGLVRVYLKDFGGKDQSCLDFEKYVNLRQGHSAKKTWFFRVDFRSGNNASRFLFFFGFASPIMAREMTITGVSLWVAYETSPFHYEKIESSQRTNLPELAEIGYDLRHEQFLCRYRSNIIMREKVESFGRKFIEHIAKRLF